MYLCLICKTSQIPFIVPFCKCQSDIFAYLSIYLNLICIQKTWNRANGFDFIRHLNYEHNFWWLLSFRFFSQYRFQRKITSIRSTKRSLEARIKNESNLQTYRFKLTRKNCNFLPLLHTCHFYMFRSSFWIKSDFNGEPFTKPIILLTRAIFKLSRLDTHVKWLPFFCSK